MTSLLPAKDAGGSPAGPCPRCGKRALGPGTFGGCPVAACASCGGHFVPRSQAHALRATFPAVGPLDRGALAKVREAAALRNLTDGVRYLACPVCAERMDRRPFALGSGLVVDRCLPHGVWFDGGELELAATYFAVGGPRDPRYGVKPDGPGRQAPIRDPSLEALIEFLAGLT